MIKVDDTEKQFGNEIDLLVACSRKAPTSETAAVIASLVAKGVDWDFLFRISYRNAVFPLVFTNLLKIAPNAMPEEFRSDISSRLRQHTESNLFLTSQAFHIVKLFESADIPILPFKGPLLSIQAYGDPALRMYGDLDLLVQPKHLDEAIRLLQKNGFEPITSVSWLKKSNWYISREKDVHFVDADGRTVLELHWKLSGSHFGLPKEMNRLWDRLESIAAAGTRLPNLSFNDLLIYLCLHGSRHSWERFGWICDIYHLLASREGIDWASIYADSKSLGCENVVALGLKLVNEFFGNEIPEPFRLSTGQNSVHEEIVSEIKNRIFTPGKVQMELGDRYAYHLKLKERRFDRWKLHLHYIAWYFKLILKPNRADRDVLQLPRLLYPAYFITRPVRLIYNHLTRSNVRGERKTGWRRAERSRGSILS